MSAMEKMVASMLGINPAQMMEMATGFEGLVKGIDERMKRIEEKLDAVIEGKQYVKSDD